MLVLGIESTCDETGCAVVCDGKVILSNVVASQEDLHAAFGGVVPEMACRRHIDVIKPVGQKALTKARITLEDIDLIAVAQGPGLIGALLIGTHFAKGLALATHKPLVGVNHIEAHLYASTMDAEPLFPALGVVISGGHTALMYMRSISSYECIGQTQDDAIGEAFDKVAKLLHLPYPGGPPIERLAKKGNPFRFPFKAGQMKGKPFDFSFSGLKTAVLYAVRGQNGNKRELSDLSEEEKRDIAASFQRAACEDLVNKSILALKEFGCRSLLLGGGVSQNRYLRSLFENKVPYPIFWPAKGLSLDNAAMIAGLGFHIFTQDGPHSYTFDPFPRIPFNLTKGAPDDSLNSHLSTPRFPVSSASNQLSKK